ncbi:DNA-binding response regulator in two-component regulatory system with KdpD [Sandaracinus amylolyticus]|nr:DNA-binding response regulator in two-component regulatory system with KdpD [Sandaracinus amylolyticus]
MARARSCENRRVASILVVEDEGPIATLVADHLQRAGHRVAIARDGDEALERHAADPADLLVLDVMLPRRSGLEVCGAIRRGGGAQPVVLMLTARSGEEDAVAGFEAGADDYVRKPFGVAELVRRVGALLALAGRPRAPAPASTIEIAGMRIDLVSRSVRVRSGEARLTPKEFDLLVHLAQHPGHVLEREDLLVEVWGYRHAGYARTVDSHVTRVRKKLAAAGLAYDPITTVHGVGYRFEPREDA